MAMIASMDASVAFVEMTDNFMLLTSPCVPAIVTNVATKRAMKGQIVTSQPCTLEKQTHSPRKIWWNLKRFSLSEMVQSFSHLLIFSQISLDNNTVINHFPHSSLITQKDSLGKQLSRLTSIFGRDLFLFAPLTFCLPQDLDKVGLPAFFF